MGIKKRRLGSLRSKNLLLQILSGMIYIVAISRLEKNKIRYRKISVPDTLFRILDRMLQTKLSKALIRP